MEETKQPDLLIYIHFDYYLITFINNKKKTRINWGLESTSDLLLYTTSSGICDSFNLIKMRYLFIMVYAIKNYTDSSYNDKL